MYLDVLSMWRPFGLGQEFIQRSKWVESRRISGSYSVIVRERVVLKIIAVDN